MFGLDGFDPPSLTFLCYFVSTHQRLGLPLHTTRYLNHAFLGRTQIQPKNHEERTFDRYSECHWDGSHLFQRGDNGGELY